MSGNPTHGQKVTPGGPSPPTKQEGPGAIPGQSLAAESLKKGGAFSENPDASPGTAPRMDDSAKSGQHTTGVAGQASYQAGTAPSAKAAASSSQENQHSASHEKKHGGGSEAKASHGADSVSSFNKAADPSDDKKIRGSTADERSHQAGKGESYAKSVASHEKEENAHTAPTYVSSQFVRDTGGPHGKNLKEGGFEGSGPGKSILAEPGSQADPGRAAEAQFAKTNPVRDPGPRQGGIDDEQPYKVLGSDKEA